MRHLKSLNHLRIENIHSLCLKNARFGRDRTNKWRRKLLLRKPFGQRLKLRVRLRGGRLLSQPSEQFQFEIALNIKNFTYWQDR
ncbi:MAG: hypothetical protein DESF_01746 [Desulfovibrio sp.]